VKLAPIAAKLPMATPAKVRIEPDLRIAHAGSFEGGPGIVIIAGTGSVCFGIDAMGNEARAGGWGPAFDDWGSAFDIGRRAISHALRVADGRSPASLLAPRIVAHLGGDLRAIAWLGATGEDRTRVASLAPIVFAAEREYDTAASAIVTMVIEELAICFEAVAKKLSFDGAIEVVIHGGLNHAGRPFFQTLYDALLRRDDRVRIVSDMLPPVMGAAMLAIKLGGAAVTDETLGAMRLSQARC
jgi:N-acetylglucosamine kinase-like BadF-type ATPase